jgi:hypothetical protein
MLQLHSAGFLVGLPFWCIGALGAVLLILDKAFCSRAAVVNCSACTYDLTGITGPCPECGATPKPKSTRSRVE